MGHPAGREKARKMVRKMCFPEMGKVLMRFGQWPARKPSAERNASPFLLPGVKTLGFDMSSHGVGLTESRFQQKTHTSKTGLCGAPGHQARGNAVP